MTDTPKTYYDIQKNWRKLKPWFEEAYIIETAYEEMEEYNWAKSDDWGFTYNPKPFDYSIRPSDYDGMDWRCDKPGRKPKYWDWACAGACHWVNNIGMLVAKFALPKHDWRIVTSNKHTTVWDGKDTLFDLNFLALGVSVERCWELASQQEDSEILPVGLVPLHE